MDEPRGRGRPKLDVPINVIDAACQFGATQQQVLSVLQNQGTPISLETLKRTIQSEFGMNFEQYRDQKLESTKLKLVQKAVKMALDGNCTMLIFCLKNMCDWRDKPKEDLDDKFRRMTTQELIVLVKEQLPVLEAAT